MTSSVITKFKPNLDFIKKHILHLATLTSSEELGYTRISFSKEDHRAREYIGEIMEREAHLSVRIDAAGNLIGRREGIEKGPCIIIGSHLDTVRGGGIFDGVVGVVAGVEVARLFKNYRITNRYPLEIVTFLAEEPSPFSISTVGSRAMVGKLPSDLLDTLIDNNGRTLGKAIREMGGVPEKIKEAEKSPVECLCYLELHIEQGPILFLQNIPIGIVTGIRGIWRGEVEIIGKGGHSGTTPMENRKDALTAAAHTITTFEKICNDFKELIGTIATIEAFPNFLNTIPAKVILGMEFRSMSIKLITSVITQFQRALDEIKKKRSVQIRITGKISSSPVEFDNKIVESISRVCKRDNIRSKKMISFAGHDASHLSELTHTGMIFIPSKDGKSHCSEEWSDFEHINLGVKVMAETVSQIDKEESS